MAAMRRLVGALQGKRTSVAAGVLLLLCIPICTLTPLEGAGSSTLAEALKAHLGTTCPWPEVAITDIAVNDRVPDTVPAKIVVDGNPPGRIPFTAEFADGKRITGTAVVRAYDRVVMSTRPNRKGYVMRDDDVYTTLMDVTRIPKGALKDTGAVVGKPLSRPVSANAPILDAMVRERPLVKRGHRVTLLAEAASFSITTYGELKSDSTVGGHVKVLNLQSKKIVSGLLVDENTVKVDF
jgi:flagella basal body P-ring formation protein FlgA